MTRGAYRMVTLERPDVVGVRSSRTSASGHPDLCCAVSLMALFVGGLLYKLVGQLLLTLLAICIDIATL
jgi:hypothetical protein